MVFYKHWFTGFLLGITFICNAQSPYSTDTEFIAAYQNEFSFYDTWPSSFIHDSFILLVSEYSTCVTISIDDLNFIKQINMIPFKRYFVALPSNFPKYTLEKEISRSISIKGNSPLSAYYGINFGLGADLPDSITTVNFTEAQTLIGRNNLGKYYIANHSDSEVNSKRHNNETIAITTLISIQNNNSLNFRLKTNTYLSANDLNFGIVSILRDSMNIINLDALDIFTFISTVHNILSEDRLTGSSFASTNNKKFALFTTPVDNTCFNNILFGGAVRFLFEQQKPVSYFGTEYHVAPLQNWCCNLYSFVATKDSTVVEIDGQAVWLLDSLDHIDTSFTGPAFFKSNYPISGYLSGCSSIGDNQNPLSPFSVTLSSDKELIKRSLFTTLTEPDTGNHYVVGLVTQTKNTGLLTLDSLPLTGVSFTPFIADSAWSWANFEVDTGVHILQSDSGFHAIHYTWYPSDSLPPGDINSFSFPAYGYVLPESIPFPQDSFYFNIKTQNSPFQYFQDYDTSICVGEILTFKPNAARHTTWQWNFGDGTDTLQTVGYQAAGEIKHSYNQPGNYWLTVNDTAFCTKRDSVLIKVIAAPIAQFTHTATLGCNGLWVQLQNQSQGAISYQWQLPNGQSAQTNPGFFYQGTSPITVTLTATDGQCSNTTTQTFTPQSTEFTQENIPNVFTPNADGVNDCFIINEALGFTDCYDLQIFNRWGDLVFTSTNPQDCWTGKNLADGVYFYVLSLGKVNYKGEVHLLR